MVNKRRVRRYSRADTLWRYAPAPNPRRVTMLGTSALYPLCRELKRHLSSVQGRLRLGLALWLKSTLLTHNCCQDSATGLDAHGCFETVRQELREWTCDDDNRTLSWDPG